MSRNKKWDRFRAWLGRLFNRPLTREILKAGIKIGVGALVNKHGHKIGIDKEDLP